MERKTERLREVIRDLKFAYCGIHAPERINLMYAISTLESIEEAEFGTWIPCDVIMPEKDTSVFVSIKEGSESYTDVAYRTDDGCGWYDNNQMSFYTNKEVIAWMPLPEPYKRNPNGKWMERKYGFECSKCGANIEGGWNQEANCMKPFDYCPLCGSRNEVSE